MPTLTCLFLEKEITIIFLYKGRVWNIEKKGKSCFNISGESHAVFNPAGIKISGWWYIFILESWDKSRAAYM